MINKDDLYKLMLSYDVEGEKLQDYYRFVMGQYMPTLQNMGLEMTEAWTSIYGDLPNRQITFVARDRDTILDLLDDDVWATLNEQLNEFVTDFDYKVIPYREFFQI